MFLKKNKIFIYTPCSLFLVFGMASMATAGGFYTIIGPDGHPMVVPQSMTAKKNVAEPKAKVSAEKAQLLNPPQPMQQQSTIATAGDLPSNSTLSNLDQAPVKAVIEKKINSPALEPDGQQLNTKIAAKLLKKPSNPQPSIDQIQTQQKKSVLAQPAQSTTAEVASSTNLKTSTSKSVETAKPEPSTENQYTVIDGVEYVNNEFLEEKEFNLAGKKRFYVMPSLGAGSTHFDTVEREKGLSRSFIDQFSNKKPIAHSPMILASSYYRLPKQEVINSLEQACFSDKKITKAKSLTLSNREVGFWPVAPIKEKFVYEVVKIDPKVQDILFTSFASSQKNPSYYWPLVVFLDQSGCVIEGVSGFKNQEFSESDFQHAAIEGVLKKPASARYLFMTPLSSAVDVENKQLSNAGQIKLSVIR